MTGRSRRTGKSRWKRPTERLPACASLDFQGLFKQRPVFKLRSMSKTLSTKASSKPGARRILKQSRLAWIEEAAKAGTLDPKLASPGRIKFGQVLEMADALDKGERESLISILQARLREERRTELVAEVEQANSEFEAGKCMPGSVGEIIKSLKV